MQDVKKKSADGDGLVTLSIFQKIQHNRHPIDEPVATDQPDNVNRPECCPGCGHKRMWAHGSYERYATVGFVGYVLIRVLRFLCPACRKTTSVLPSHCIPYRAQDVSMVMRYLAYGAQGVVPGQAVVPRYEEDLKRCERRWQYTYPLVLTVLTLTLVPRSTEVAREVMRALLGLWPNPKVCQRELLHRHGVSLFGTYRIHDWARTGRDPVKGVAVLDSG